MGGTVSPPLQQPPPASLQQDQSLPHRAQQPSRSRHAPPMFQDSSTATPQRPRFPLLQQARRWPCQPRVFFCLTGLGCAFSLCLAAATLQASTRSFHFVASVFVPNTHVIGHTRHEVCCLDTVGRGAVPPVRGHRVAAPQIALLPRGPDAGVRAAIGSTILPPPAQATQPDALCAPFESAGNTP